MEGEGWSNSEMQHTPAKPDHSDLLSLYLEHTVSTYFLRGKRMEQKNTTFRWLSPLSQLPDLLLLVKLDHPEPPQKIQAIFLVGVRGRQYHVEFRQPLRGSEIGPVRYDLLEKPPTCLLTCI